MELPIPNCNVVEAHLIHYIYSIVLRTVKIKYLRFEDLDYQDKYTFKVYDLHKRSKKNV